VPEGFIAPYAESLCQIPLCSSLINGDGPVIPFPLYLTRLIFLYIIQSKYITGLSIRGPMPQIHRYEFVVPREAEDRNGHVNNVEYLRWMQDAAMRHSDTSGCTAATNAVGATWVVRSHKIVYLKPAFAGDRVVVCTWVASLRRVQSLRRYKVFRQTDGALLAQGETEWVFVDARKGSLRSIPRDVKTAFEVLPEGQEKNIFES